MLEKVKNPDPLAPVDYKSDSPVEDFKVFEDSMRQILGTPKEQLKHINNIPRGSSTRWDKSKK